MKKADIVVGGTYSDGKKGVRKVVGEGAEYNLPGTEDVDRILYEVVKGKLPAYPWSPFTPQTTCTRTAFASWAKVRVDKED